MRQIMSADMALALFGVVFSAALVPTALAEDALDPMTGVGGIMRDAERRALAHTDTCGGKPASAPAAVDPSLFNIRNGTVYGLNQNIDAEELVIPAGVKGVCIDGLVHGNVRRIVIPEGVVRLGRQSGGYRPGTKIEAVKLPASVRELSPTAFDGHWSRLHSIEVAEGSPYLMKDGCLIDTRNDSLVFALPGQERIIVPPSVKTIGEYAFNSNDATEIVIPEGVLEIGRGAFYDCRSLEQISIPASLIAIKSDAFKNCGRLAKIAVAHGNQRFSARDGLLIDRESATLLRAFGPLVSVTISDDVRIIGANAFSFLKSVVSIVVPDSVRRIEDGAFSYCTNLEVLRLPEQVEFCEDHFIMGCESLRSVHIPKGLGSLSGMFSIGGCSSLREIVLPEGLRTISTGGLGAICRCDALERIVLPSSVTRIGPGGAFRENKNLKMFEVHPDNLAFRSEDGVLFSKDMTRLVRCPEAKMGVYKIPDTVQKIDACAFAQCRNLSEIYIPTSVTDIGYGAFKDCPAKTNRVTTLNGEASQSAAKIGRPQKEEHTKTEHGFVASGVFGDSLSRGLVAGFTFATDTSDFIHPERLFRIAHESSRKPLVSNGVLPLNGCYSGPTNTTTDVAISELRYDRFSVAVSFKPDFDGVRYGMPLISFGGGWRWFHVFLNKDGNVDISFRGLFARDVIHFKLKDKFSKNGWNSFVVTFDFDSRRLVAALNHGERAEFDLPNDFAYRFQSDDWDRCRSVQFANLNNGSVFKGEIDSLLLYNRPLSWNEMQQFFGRKILKELFNPGLWGGKSMAMMPSVANRQGSGLNWRIEATDEACFYWNGRLSDGRWALDARLDGHGISVGLERPRGDGVLDLRKPVLDGTGRTVPIVGIGLDDMKLSHVGVSHSAPIESVNLPDTLIWLGPGALEDCDRLTSVKLPQSLRRIGSCAFSGCSNLNRIEIPTDVEFLSRDRVFMGCSSLEEIVVQSEKAGYKTEDGVLFSSDGKILVAYPGGRRGPYRVPKGVKRISERAFLGCSRLTELYIPASVREIEDYALAGCKGLKHIEFEDSSFDLNQDRVFGRSYPGRPSVSRPTTNLQANHMPETEVSTGKRSEKDTGKPSTSFDGSMSNSLSSGLEKKAKAETTITVDQGLVETMAVAIKDSLRQPKSKMENFARNMATFPSWNKSLKGMAYSVGDYVCILHKSPPLDIDADSYRWKAGLGSEKYRARIKELRTSNLSYLHSLAIYNPTWCDGAVPIPCIVLTVELSRSTEVPYVCAFTPDGHKNFGKSEALSSDAGMLLNSLAAVSLAFDKTPDKIGDAEEGFSLLKRMMDKPKGNKTTCTNCKGSGLVNGSICLECKGWGKMSDDKRQR